ncbi:MAG: ornithine cyclodeaminase family protein [Mogibacterium sp.]|nr:ornithine cyclodeaminase family protein [Mogibacterium sp.]
MLALSEKDMREVFTMKDAIEADKDALRLYTEGQTNIPLRANISVPEHSGNSLYMYGYVAPADALGVKLVSVYPKNVEKGIPSVPATMVLVNSETGEVCSLMNGTYLTALRTGAVAGAATDVLAREDSKIFALIGTGGQAETQLEAVLAVRDIELVKVYSRNRERREAFVAKMNDLYAEKYGVKIVAAESSDEAVADADIISACTTANEAVFDADKIKKNAHINGVGSYTPDMAEIPEGVITSAAGIYVDTAEGVLAEAGELINPIKKGLVKEESCIELGAVLAGKAEGRKSYDDLTFFDSVGCAVLDLVTAQRIYEKAVAKGMGQIIEL